MSNPTESKPAFATTINIPAGFVLRVFETLNPASPMVTEHRAVSTASALRAEHVSSVTFELVRESAAGE